MNARTRFRRQLCCALLCLAFALPAWTRERSAEVNYILRCAGCHDLDGSGLASAGIPPFPGFISSFVNDADGRTYIMHVPGVVASGLNDAEIAAVMNYVTARWGDQQPFERFTTAEVTQRRALPVADVVIYRREVVKRLAAAGLPIAEYPWP